MAFPMALRRDDQAVRSRDNGTREANFDELRGHAQDDELSLIEEPDPRMSREATARDQHQLLVEVRDSAVDGELVRVCALSNQRACERERQKNDGGVLRST